MAHRHAPQWFSLVVALSVSMVTSDGEQTLMPASCHHPVRILRSILVSARRESVPQNLLHLLAGQEKLIRQVSRHNRNHHNHHTGVSVQSGAAAATAKSVDVCEAPPPEIAKYGTTTESKLAEFFAESSDEASSSDETGPSWSRASGTTSTAGTAAESDDEVWPARVLEEVLEAIKDIPQELIPEWLAKQTLALRMLVHLAPWQRDA